MITMMRNQDHSESTYRTAMALNNLGVSMMMEQGGLHHAIMLFKDSFSVMNSELYIPRGGEFGDVFLLQDHEVQHQQEPQQQQSFHSVMAQAGKMMPLHPLEIFPCDNDDMSVMTRTLLNVALFVPIRLRSRDFYDPQVSHKNSNLCLAIMMYNHGVAHLLAHVQDKRWHVSCSSSMCGSATMPATSPHGQELLRGAIVSLNCAQVMIDRHLEIIGHDGFEKLETLLISTMTLKTMMWMSRFDNQSREAEQVHALLTKVLADIEICNQHLHEFNVSTCHQVTLVVAA